MGYIAIVEDEPDILKLVSVSLEKFGFEVKGFLNSSSFLKSAAVSKPDLIILDLMLPDMDGFEVCKHLKSRDEYKNIPVIVLSARSDESDKVLGLEIGADDYVTKPFSPRELVARVKSVLRRWEVREQARKIVAGKDLEMDRDRYEVLVKGKKVDFTTTEFKILELILSGKGKVFTRNEILSHLWGGEKFVVDRTVDVHVRNIREKLGSVEGVIKNVRGVGYRSEE